MTNLREVKDSGSTVQSNGECEREVKKRVPAGWGGWRRVEGVICDRRVPARVKGKVCRTVARPDFVIRVGDNGTIERTGGGAKERWQS